MDELLAPADPPIAEDELVVVVVVGAVVDRRVLPAFDELVVEVVMRVVDGESVVARVALAVSAFEDPAFADPVEPLATDEAEPVVARAIMMPAVPAADRPAAANRDPRAA